MGALLLAVAYAFLCGSWVGIASEERKARRTAAETPDIEPMPTANEADNEDRHRRAQRAAWRAYDRVYQGYPAAVDFAEGEK